MLLNSHISAYARCHAGKVCGLVGSAWGTSQGEDKPGARDKILNTKVACRARARQTFPPCPQAVQTERNQTAPLVAAGGGGGGGLRLGPSPTNPLRQHLRAAMASHEQKLRVRVARKLMMERSTFLQGARKLCILTEELPSGQDREWFMRKLVFPTLQAVMQKWLDTHRDLQGLYFTFLSVVRHFSTAAQVQWFTRHQRINLNRWRSAVGLQALPVPEDPRGACGGAAGADRDAAEGKGPRRQPLSVTTAVEAGICRRHDSGWAHRLGALEGGGGYLSPFPMHPWVQTRGRCCPPWPSLAPCLSAPSPSAPSPSAPSPSAVHFPHQTSALCCAVFAGCVGAAGGEVRLFDRPQRSTPPPFPPSARLSQVHKVGRALFTPEVMFCKAQGALDQTTPLGIPTASLASCAVWTSSPGLQSVLSSLASSPLGGLGRPLAEAACLLVTDSQTVVLATPACWELRL